MPHNYCNIFSSSPDTSEDPKYFWRFDLSFASHANASTSMIELTPQNLWNISLSWILDCFQVFLPMKTICANYELANYGNKLLPFPSSLHDTLNININKINVMWWTFLPIAEKKISKNMWINNFLIEIHLFVHTCKSIQLPSSPLHKNFLFASMNQTSMQKIYITNSVNLKWCRV